MKKSHKNVGKSFHDTPTLSYPLNEFVQALEDEINCARRSAASNAIQLYSGKRVSRMAQEHQYRFKLESTLNVPSDAPADLSVYGRKPIPATIISIEGLSIFISINEDLGDSIPEARLVSDLTILMRRLIERITDLSRSENPAAARMLSGGEIRGEPVIIAKTNKLNPSQHDALQSSIGRDLTFIWGPPGTGKTRTIGEIGLHLFDANRSLLLVSHTNIAVDQALINIAENISCRSPDSITKGDVIRLGTPRDRSLERTYPDTLLKMQAEKRANELVVRKTNLETEKKSACDALNEVIRAIEIIEWIPLAEKDIAAVAAKIEFLHELDNRINNAKTEETRLRPHHIYWQRAKEYASRVCKYAKDEDILRRQSTQLQNLLKNIAEQRWQLSKSLKEENDSLQKSKYVTPIRRELSKIPSSIRLNICLHSINEAIKKFESVHAKIEGKLAAAKTLLVRIQSTGKLARMWRRLPKIEVQQSFVRQLEKNLQVVSRKLSEHQNDLAKQNELLGKVRVLEENAQQYADIRNEDEQVQIIKGLEEQDVEREQKANQTKQDLLVIQNKLSQIEQFKNECKAKYNITAGELLAQSEQQLVEYELLCSKIKELTDSRFKSGLEVDAILHPMVDCLRDWGLTSEHYVNAEMGITIVSNILNAAKSRVANVDRERLNQKKLNWQKKIDSLKQEIDDIEQKLKDIQNIVLRQATIIGTTLTQAYLNDVLHDRKFDTVILDEASMAPIPALWAAADMAKANLVVVGDFKQLPPIVQSKRNLAQKWLGEDIFSHTGIYAKYIYKQAPHFIALQHQYRMHPDISAIPRNMFYEEMRDADEVKNTASVLPVWYQSSWPNDSPVLLIDTGSLNAWVTSVMRGRRTSRLNFLSAVLSVEIAEQILRPDRPHCDQETERRIILVSPYNPHAKFVSHLIKDQKLDEEVSSGTIHSFQGCEADVVVFDLVIDEPHFRANLFMPGNDKELKRLFNVALTRAKKRLFIVGNFEYCLKRSKKAFLGRELIPFLPHNYRRVDAKDILPAGSAARMAEVQLQVYGGTIEPSADRLVVTHEDFYRFLTGDILKAQKRIVIFSAFMKANRMSKIDAFLREALERGVEIIVVTRGMRERNKAEFSECQIIEKRLRDAGVKIIHKVRMHEKLVFIDDTIVWSGSLNPLSYRASGEIMERRASRSVFSDYANTLQLDQLLKVLDPEGNTCPCCFEGEILAVEGANEPFYWKCSNCDYTRSIGQEAPKDGLMRCPKDGASFVFNASGKRPVWQCTKNKRHRYRLRRSDLLLPKMVQLIPAKDRVSILTKFNTPTDRIRAEQMRLNLFGVLGEPIKATRAFRKAILCQEPGHERASWIFINDTENSVIYANTYDGKLGKNFDPEKAKYSNVDPVRLKNKLREYKEVDISACDLVEQA